MGLNTFFTGDKAYTLGVNAWVLNAPPTHCRRTNRRHRSPRRGDNRNALALEALEDAAVGPEGRTVAEIYQALVMNLGLDTEDAKNQQDFFQGLVKQLTRMRDTVSGVSLDEELTNLGKFQRAY